MGGAVSYLRLQQRESRRARAHLAVAAAHVDLNGPEHLARVLGDGIRGAHGAELALHAAAAAAVRGRHGRGAAAV